MSVSRQAAKTVQLLADKVDIKEFFQYHLEPIFEGNM